jgi:phosphoribosyl-ATP pyrophosphohydrolase/phosphoribosyl-AMP cyclohydrolase
VSIHPDCDRDSLIYLGEPLGPSCHTGSETCWFERVTIHDGVVTTAETDDHVSGAPQSTLLELEAIIAARKREADGGDGVLKSFLHGV